MRPGVIVSSLLLTVLIFVFGILLNYGLDFLRIGSISGIIAQHELDTTAYLVEQEFTDSFGGNRCVLMSGRFEQLKEEIQQVGTDLGSYSSFSFLKKKDYDYLKRKYFLLELRFLALIEQLNNDCNHPYIPILFFYEIDDDASERQGFVLGDLSKAYAQQVVVLSFDKDYADEPLIPLIVARENITRDPTMILDNIKMEGLQYTGVLNETIGTLLRRADPVGQAHDFTYVLRAAGRDVSEFVTNLSALLTHNLSPYARADLLLILGRVTKNETMICDSLSEYDRALASTNDHEEQALLYETIAAIDCGRNKKDLFHKAAQHWRQLNNTARAVIDESIANGKKINLQFDTSDITPVLNPPAHVSQIIIGETGIVLLPGAKMLTQADRVKRDWLGLQLNDSLFGNQILATFSERLWYNASELREDIGWHEGGRIKELVSAGITPLVAYGTLAARLEDKWYALDDQGMFRFEVPLDKLRYPTTRFIRENLAVIMDTHGVNMLVEQSIRNKVDAVLSDCDHPDKVKAAAYLSMRGIPVACFPDKYVYLAMGHNASLLGSPSINRLGGQIVIGHNPVAIGMNETIVVVNSTSHPYALWYYQTPANYFSTLKQALPQLRLDYVQLNDFGQMSKVIVRAEQLNATLIAARVFNTDDYGWLKRWLLSSPSHRAILFHSTSYPYGYLLTKEFPAQTSFDDPNPRFIS
jgi:hypothetical protein